MTATKGKGGRARVIKSMISPKASVTSQIFSKPTSLIAKIPKYQSHDDNHVVSDIL